MLEVMTTPGISRLHVGFDATPLVGDRTGVGIAVFELHRALGELQSGPVLHPFALSRRARSRAAELPVGTNFVPVPARVLVRAWARTDAPSIDRWLGSIDLIHATNFLAPPSRHPVIVTIYDCSFVRFPDECTPAIRRFEPVLRRALRRGAWVHVTSQFVADEVIDVFGRDLVDHERVIVVPLGVPPQSVDVTVEPPTEKPAQHRTTNGSPYVLAVGTTETRKNHAGLIRAFGLIAGEHPDLRLVIAGGPGMAQDAVRTARDNLPLGVRDRVVLTGRVGDATLRTLRKDAHALAYPSTYEGFGFPVLEAMAQGIPVIATRAGSIPEVAGDAAVLVDPLDDEALAEGLARITEDDALREDLVRRGISQAGKFTWRAAAEGLLDGYHRVAGAER